MSPRDLSNRRILEVQETLANSFRPRPGTDVDQLGQLCKAVLGSIDVRDLGKMSTDELVTNLEHVLRTIRTRRSGEIVTNVRLGKEDIVIESCVDDQPFLVSALRALAAAEKCEVKSSLNAISKLRRDSSGKLLEFGQGTAESIIRMEVRPTEGEVSQELMDRLATRVDERMRVAQAMVQDFRSMKRHVQTAADEYGHAATRASGETSVLLRECEELLRWLCDENYVLFSVEDYGAQVANPTMLGASRIVGGTRNHDLIRRSATGEARKVRYQRSTEDSPVHRAGKPGHFIVTRVDRSGTPVGAIVIDGLFTYKALHTPPEEIPYLRVTLRDMFVDQDVGADSHRGKNMANAFNSLPLEFLLTESKAAISELTDRVLRAEEEGGSDVHIQRSDDDQSVFVVVTLPREQFSEELRLQLQELLMTEFGATYADYGVYLDRYENAIVHFYVTGQGSVQSVDTERISSKVRELSKGWNERLRDSLEGMGEDDELFELYVGAFNEEHKRRAATERIRGDIECLERLRGGQTLDTDLFVSLTGDYPGSLNLRVFNREPMGLSKELPVISNFGFDVIDEYSREIKIAHMPTIEMHNYRLDVRRGRHRQVLGRKESIRRALDAVFAGELGDDSLNRLVVSTSLSGHDVEILRALVAYLHQLRTPYATELVRATLVGHPTVSQALVGVLSARFDPSSTMDEPAALATLEAELSSVTDYTADRVLDSVAQAVRAIVRTNAFVADLGSGEALAFKIDGHALSYGPMPRPFREIWVHHQEFEGVHLRGGSVARGGLRFSDRRDDFRTEIHGLMATQMVKNVLIVPMGAKGGFVLRNPPAGRKQLRAAGDHYYGRFIRSLLSITDNVVDGKTVTPPNIRHSEGDDPYLVVAADKGTAHLSDTANRISMKQGFWLDDAFASGGSNGYDHKKTGITARGAWEANKRNFRELGIDPEADPITAIGVGDMSGDVFGNGLLLSKTLRLLAAFNHMHIFIDPNPDPATSYEERKRLFEMDSGSSWEDYKVLSEGGGVWPRKSKNVDLTPQARMLLGFAEDQSVSGDEVIKAIMTLKVDLFWMGGIGTYVKAAAESHADVGDKANDAVRVDARELNCRVFAEGANLAITDRGRVEFAKRGGLNYTAFLDNSGGVDTSDHEVNIKILYAPLLAAGSATRDQRNEVMVSVEDEVCEMVLANNRSQSRMVSFDVARSKNDIYRYSRTMEYLAREVPFRPEAFSMPSEEELANRTRRGDGLFKCEAAVLGSHAKMLAYRQLLADEKPPNWLTKRLSRAYFPKRVLDATGDAVGQHLLRHEIATTMLVNGVVDNMGASFFAEVMSSTRKSALTVVRAYTAAHDLGEVARLREELYALEDKHRQPAVYVAMGVLADAMESATYFILDNVDEIPDIATIEKGKELLETLGELLPKRDLRKLSRRAARLAESGIPTELALAIGRLRHLNVVLDAIALADVTGKPPAEMVKRRLEVAQAMHMPELYSTLSTVVRASPYDGPAVSALHRQLEFHVHKMTRLAGDDPPEAMIERYALGPLKAQVRDQLDGEVSIAGLVMLDSLLRRLLPPMQ